VIAALVVLALLLGSLVMLWRSQERILFQPPRFQATSVESERVDYRAADGQPLVGFLVGNPRTAPGVLLSFHGNADLAVWQLDWARVVEARTGYAVLLSEYRGYMALGGTPTYPTSKLDALAALDYLVSVFGVDQRRVVYFGHSLGSAVATELAVAREPRALLLQSPFSSARAMAGLIVIPPIGLVWKALSRIHFDTAGAVMRLSCPVSVAHGRRDRIVPVRMGLEVFKASKVKGRLLLVEQAGHNDVAEVAGEEYWKWLSEAFIASP
jgi:fermentation-respiration switch protein FrsA (DUF1100 family)